jgi:16S rRNA (cytidine1402-2'-O)-methyltransferase
MTVIQSSQIAQLPVMGEAAQQSYPTATLYIVATPIGNVTDITLRALQVLTLADVVACEDTRKTGALLTRFGLHKPMLAAHQHNEREVAEKLIERLRQGERVALVSDAGTPGVSDPGARIVDAVRNAGLRVVPLPGPSAAIAALVGQRPGRRPLPLCRLPAGQGQAARNRTGRAQADGGDPRDL